MGESLEELRAFAALLHLKILGQALGLDILSGVGFPLEDRAAVGAGPGPPPGGDFLRHDAAAGGTGPGGGEAAVNDQKLFSLPRQLVAQALPEHPVAGVTDISKACDFVELVHLVRSHAHGVPGVGYPPGFLLSAPMIK